MKFFLALSLLSPAGTYAFHPPRPLAFSSFQLGSTLEDVETAKIDERTGKPTGTSFLPEETIARAQAGNPTEKVKLEKDATSAWVDVYEYARKIREGEMTWEEVEKADLDTVSTYSHLAQTPGEPLSSDSSEAQICRYASSRKTYSRSVHDAA